MLATTATPGRTIEYLVGFADPQGRVNFYPQDVPAGSNWRVFQLIKAAVLANKFKDARGRVIDIADVGVYHVDPSDRNDLAKLRDPANWVAMDRCLSQIAVSATPEVYFFIGPTPTRAQGMTTLLLLRVLALTLD